MKKLAWIFSFSLFSLQPLFGAPGTPEERPPLSFLCAEKIAGLISESRFQSFSDQLHSTKEELLADPEMPPAQAAQIILDAYFRETTSSAPLNQNLRALWQIITDITFDEGMSEKEGFQLIQYIQSDRRLTTQVKQGLIANILIHRLMKNPSLVASDVQNLIASHLRPPDERLTLISFYIEALRQAGLNLIEDRAFKMRLRNEIAKLWVEQSASIYSALETDSRRLIRRAFASNLYGSDLRARSFPRMPFHIGQLIQIQNDLNEERWRYNGNELDELDQQMRLTQMLERSWNKYFETQQEVNVLLGELAQTSKEDLAAIDHFFTELGYIRGLILNTTITLQHIDSQDQNLSDERIRYQLERELSQILILQRHLSTFYDQARSYGFESIHWETARQIATINVFIKTISLRRGGILGDLDSEIRALLRNVFDDDTTNWAAKSTSDDPAESVILTRLADRIRQLGFHYNEIPQEWLDEMKTPEDWQRIYNRIKTRYALNDGRGSYLTTGASPYALSTMRYALHILIEAEHLEDRSGIPWAREHLVSRNISMRVSEERLFQLLADRRYSADTRFMIYKRIRNIWRMREELEQGITQIPGYRHNVQLMGVLQSIRSHQLSDPKFLLFYNVISRAELVRRENYIESIDFLPAAYSAEDLHWVGLAFGFEDFVDRTQKLNRRSAP